MTKRRLRGGQILFRKNDPAGEMFMSPPCDCGSWKLLSTCSRAASSGNWTAGACARKRSNALKTQKSCGLTMIASNRSVSRIPSFGFYLLCLTSARLFQNIAKLETTLEGHNQEIVHLQRGNIAKVMRGMNRRSHRRCPAGNRALSNLLLQERRTSYFHSTFITS